MPEESWNKGDPRRGGRRHVTTAVSYRSHAAAEEQPGEHLADLLAQIEPLAARLHERVAAGDRAVLKLAVFADTDNPAFSLPAGILARVGALGFEFFLDIYEV